MAVRVDNFTNNSGAAAFPTHPHTFKGLVG